LIIRRILVVAALNTLSDVEKPQIEIFYSKNAPIDYLESLKYPYIHFVLFKPFPSRWFLRKVNSLICRISGMDIYKYCKFFSKVDCIYPYIDFVDFHFNTIKNKAYWLVDFNNRVFPNHYADDGKFMNEYQIRITNSSNRVVLSSNSLLNELKQYHPTYQCDIRILRFASSIKLLEQGPEFLEKYGLKETSYFMSPNQFWEHKNQKVVLEAIGLIRINRPELKFKVIFTGSLEVNRGKGLYVENLKKMIIDLNIHDYVSFLGVIDRADQILLMKKSVALIQPSFYEGWSTLVEESKAMSQLIILSDIPVHREQILTNADFFNPTNPGELATKLLNHIESPRKALYVEYKTNIQKYGKDLINALTF
jgi:glycosyltransferase involved in cell wall biosynthesis